jgi:hypothetical protein
LKFKELKSYCQSAFFLPILASNDHRRQKGLFPSGADHGEARPKALPKGRAAPSQTPPHIVPKLRTIFLSLFAIDHADASRICAIYIKKFAKNCPRCGHSEKHPPRCFLRIPKELWSKKRKARVWAD